jgi:hypothetical protein
MLLKKARARRDEKTGELITGHGILWRGGVLK